MNKRTVIFFTAVLTALLLTASFAAASGMFVATAKNFRGALYQGYGPSPGHASEMAIVKCSQDSFIAPSCKVIAVRMECPPPQCMAPMPMRKPIRKARASEPYPVPYGRPMP